MFLKGAAYQSIQQSCLAIYPCLRDFLIHNSCSFGVLFSGIFLDKGKTERAYMKIIVDNGC